MENLVRITRVPRETFYQNLLELNEKKKMRILEPQLPLLELSKYFSERIVTAAGTPIPECTTCGVCCAFALMVPVSMDDSPRLTDIVEITLDNSSHEIGVDRVLPRDVKTGHCMHLAGELGTTIGCTIYNSRPSVCREFEAGSDRCHEYRRIYGIEPQLGAIETAIAIHQLACVERVERISDAQIVAAETTSSFSFSVHEQSSTSNETVRLKILASVNDDAPFEIHDFDPAEETWLESDLLALTVSEAEQLIAARKQQG